MIIFYEGTDCAISMSEGTGETVFTARAVGQPGQ